MKRIVPLLLALALVGCGTSSSSSSDAPASGGVFSATTFAVREVTSLNGVDVTGRGILLSIEQANWQTTYAGIATLWMRDTTGCSEIYYLNSDIDVTAGGGAGNLSGDWIAGGPCDLPTGRSASATARDVRGTLSVDAGGSGATLTLTHPYERTIVAGPSSNDWLILRAVSDTPGATASLYESYFILGTPVSFFEWPTLPWQKIFAMEIGDGVNHDSYFFSISADGAHPASSYTASMTMNGICLGHDTGATPSFSYRAP